MWNSIYLTENGLIVKSKYRACNIQMYVMRGRLGCMNRAAGPCVTGVAWSATRIIKFKVSALELFTLFADLHSNYFYTFNGLNFNQI